MKLGKRAQQWIWRLTLAIGLIVEVAFIVVAIAAISHGAEGIEPWQAIAFMVIAVWIYIAYLKQRSLDISKHVVDEKIKTHSLVHHLKDGIIVLDENNRVLLLNARAAAVTGLSELELLGQDLTPRLDRALGEMLTTGQSGEAEGRLAAQDRTVRMSLVTLPPNPEGEQNKIVYIEAVERPAAAETVAASSPAQAHRQAADLVGAMAAALAADPTAPTDRAQRALLALRGEAARCRLLGLAVAAGDLTALPEAAAGKARQALDELLRPILAADAALSAATGVALDGPAANPALIVEGQLALLGLALRQVLANALLDATAGAKAVTVRTASMGAHVGIMVLDKGPALAPQALAGLFEATYRGLPGAQNQTVRADSGGLYLARRIVETQGGTLTADTAPDGGLRVTLMLPGAV